MLRHLKPVAACIVGLLLPVASAYAQGFSDGGLVIDEFDANGQSVKIGETNLVPSLRIDYSSTDNTFRTLDNTLENTRIVLRPTVNWYAERRLVDLRATYQGSFAQASENAPNFADHLLGFSANAEFNSKNRSFASVSLSSEHDDIGRGVLSNASGSIPTEVAEATNFQLSASHTYGARTARGNITGGLRLQSRNFRNLATFTTGRDFFRVRPFARFSYRASADTRFIIGGNLSNLTFDNDSNDRLDTTIFSGVNMEATGKLSGTFRIGATQSSFSNSNRSDQTSLFLDADLLYRPSNFALLRLGLRREVDNSRASLNSLGSAIDTRINASWQHRWSSRISTRAAIDIEQLEAVCPQPSDVVTTPSFELEFALRRWIAFGLRTSVEQRRVSLCTDTVIDDQTLADFERQDIGFFVRGSL